MSKAPTDLELQYPDGQRERLKLRSKPLNQGADGAIYAAPGNKLALKLYHDPKKDPERPEKIRQMLKAPPDDSGLQHFAWPVAQITTRQGRFVGYAMPLLPVSSYVSLDLLLTRKGRQLGKLPENREFRVKAAANLAQRVAQLHAKGHCIIDMKPANLLVHRKTTDIVVVDCDGFAIQGENGFIPGHQFTSGYIAPEAWKEQLKPEALGQAQDLFALAAIIFQLVNEGLHPYQGIPADKQEIPGDTQNRIGQGLYPYGQKPDRRIKPSPWSVHLDFPKALTQAFELAFNSSDQRPSADHWAHLLQQASGELKACRKNRNHDFWGSSCPLCAQSSVTVEVKKTRTRPAPQARPRPVVQPYQYHPPQAQTQPQSNSGSLLFKGVSVVFAMLLAVGYVYHLYDEERRTKQYYAERLREEQRAASERHEERLKAQQAEKIRNAWRDTGERATATSVHVSTYPLPATRRSQPGAKATPMTVPFFQPQAFSSVTQLPLLHYTPLTPAWEYTGEHPLSRVTLNPISDQLTENEATYTLNGSSGYQLRDAYIHPESEALYVRKCGFQLNCYELARITPDGKETVYQIEEEPQNDGSGHRRAVDAWRFAVTKDEQHLIVAGHLSLRIYRVANPDGPVAEVEYPSPYLSYDAADLAITPDGHQIYVGLSLNLGYGAQYNATVLEFTQRDGRPVLTRDFNVGWPDDGSMAAATVDVSADGTTLALGSYQDQISDDSTYTQYGKPVTVKTAKAGITVWQKQAEQGNWKQTGRYVLDRQDLLKAPSRPGMLMFTPNNQKPPGSYRFNIGFDLTPDGTRLLSGIETQTTRQTGTQARAWVLDIKDGIPEMRTRLQRSSDAPNAYPFAGLSTRGSSAVLGWADYQMGDAFARTEGELHLALTAFSLGK